MRKIYILGFVFAVLFYTNAGAQTTVNFTADRDNTMYSENSNVSNGAGQNFFAGSTAAGARRRGLIHFNLGSIPANATVTAVTITLNCNKQAAASAGITLHRVSADWGEGTSDASVNEGSGAAATVNDATWASRFHPSTAWSSPGGDYNSTASATISSVGAGTVTISSPGITADVQTFVTNSASNFGWVVVGSAESTTSTALRFASSENPTTSSRPQISITYNVVTPVTLQRFFAVRQGEQAILNWQTATEQQNDYFEVQHSKNGQQYAALGRVKGAGNSVTAKEYSFIHANAGSGKNFYRLAQYDTDGKVHYSSVVVLALQQQRLQLSPNPALNFIHLTTASMLAGATYQIISVAGQRVQQGIVSGPVPVSQLAPGHYQLMIRNSEGDWLRSAFIKN